MISCLIPAYNEEKNIRETIIALKNCGLIDEIIVISDGSTDRTAEIAESLGVKVIKLEKNCGKGRAIVEGLKYARGNIILLVDADLRGLNSQNLRKLIDPILNNEAEMVIGKNISFVMNNLSSLRSIKRFIFEETSFVEKLKNSGYNIENLLNNRIKQMNLRTKYVKMEGVRNVHKIKKYGLKEGFKKTLKMYLELFLYLFKKY